MKDFLIILLKVILSLFLIFLGFMFFAFGYWCSTFSIIFEMLFIFLSAICWISIIALIMKL